MHRVILILVFKCLHFLNLAAQPQANNWFFSRNHGISFAGGIPVNVSGGQVSAMEGASTVSDSNGNLLFYTDGQTVWNRNHTVIGTGLAGGSGSSTQAAVIIPKTADEKEWYVFTTDEEGRNRGLQYSVVDVTGTGSITLLNQPLVTPSSEKVTAVRHCNRKDYWVLTHHYGSDAYYAYLVTSSGVNPIPIISNTGQNHPVAYGTMAGTLKSSPDGKWLAAATFNIGVELSSFDNNTGIVSGTETIFQIENSHPYTVEFSANSTKLYAGVSGYWDNIDFKHYSGVFQYDLSAGNVVSITASKVQLAKIGMPSELGCMQRGPDGKIYMAQFQKRYLSVINAPDLAGAACNYVDIGFELPHPNDFSLPNMINDYGVQTDSISTSSVCVNSPVSFRYHIASGVDSVRWSFGDISSFANTSSLESPSHIFGSSGIYPIELIKYSRCGNDTVRRNITVGEVLVDLGADTTICEGSTLLLDPGPVLPSTFLWQNGSKGPSFLAAASGIYWVDVLNTANGCSKRDSITIVVKAVPFVSLGKDTVLCPDETLLLNAGNPGASYVWQNGSTHFEQLVAQKGSYWVEVTLNGCSKADTIIVSSSLPPEITLGPDRFLCPGLVVDLSPNPNSGYQFLWQDGSFGESHVVRTPGLYYVTATNSCGSFTDSVIVSPGDCTLYVPSAFSPNSDGLNDEFRILGTGRIDRFVLSVFDRSGQLLFRTDNKNAGWDGTAKGRIQPNGVYIYMLQYTNVGETNTKLMKGSLVLVR